MMMARRSTVSLLILLLSAACRVTTAFQTPSRLSVSCRTDVVGLRGKKKGRGGGSKPKGFGKVVEEQPTTTKAPSASEAQTMDDSASSSSESPLPKGSFLQPVPWGTDATPAIENFDNLPPEERTKQILKQKYGMKTMEEQQASEKQMQQLKAQQKRLAELKKKAELNEDVDWIAMIPAPVLRGLDTFLKAGVAISGLAFVLSGFAITAEAWSKASGQALPADIDNFIVNVVEPNFTPGLLVVLGFSVSLGALAAAQLGSEGAQYKE